MDARIEKIGKLNQLYTELEPQTKRAYNQSYEACWNWNKTQYKKTYNYVKMPLYLLNQKINLKKL